MGDEFEVDELKSIRDYILEGGSWNLELMRVERNNVVVMKRIEHSRIKLKRKR
jgi:hypothetical protein